MHPPRHPILEAYPVSPSHLSAGATISVSTKSFLSVSIHPFFPFFERGWTPESPREDINEEALPAPDVA